MPNQPNGKNGGKVEWAGEERLDHSPTIIVEKFRVNGEDGRSCHGSLSLYDEAFRRIRQFTWEAQYIGDGHWNITSPIAGEAASDCLNRNRSVNHDMTILMQNRLNAMRNEGTILRPQPKPSPGDQPKPPTPSVASRP